MAPRITQTPTPPSDDPDTGGLTSSNLRGQIISHFGRDAVPTESLADPDDAQAIAKNVAALKTRLKGRSGSSAKKGSGRAKASYGSGASSPAMDSGTE